MAGVTFDSTVEQVRGASDIIDVIGAYVPLKRRGVAFVALCPFHREKTPSFTVSPAKQLYHCYGCHKGGDVFTFLQDYENLSFPEALRRLADRAGIPLQSDQTPGHQKSKQIKDRLLDIHEQITQRWQHALSNESAGQIARDYLAQRGVSPEAIKLFRLGYAPNSWDDTLNWGKSKGHDPGDLEQAGLVIPRENEAGYYDRFRGRLMFPICDEQGRVIAFSGRVLDSESKGGKYVNSPETAIFKKGKVIYGLDKSKRALLDSGFAIVCEGQLDLISCFMSGVKNVVAPQGTALTGEHARLLKRYVQEVVLCFDSDNAGQKATVNSLDELIGSGLAIRVAAIPAPHDPDSLIRDQGGSAFQSLIQRAPNFFDFYLDYLCRSHDISTDKGRLVVLGEMSAAVKKTGNNMLADTYAQKTALRLAVSPEAVRAEFKKNRPKTLPPDPASETEQSPAADAQPLVRPNTPEWWLLRILLMEDDEALDWAAKHLEVEWIQHSDVRQVIARRLDAHANRTWQGPAALLGELRETPASTLITAALVETRPIPNCTTQLVDIGKRLRDEFVNRQISELRRRAYAPNAGATDINELLRQETALRQQKREPLKPRL